MDAKDKRIAELEALLKTALEDNERLKAKIAKLEKNSSNSSKPPSSDIVKPRKNKDRRRKRKIGAQKGHKQHKRQPFTNDQIDQTIELKQDICPKCKRKLTVTEKAPKIFQQVELVGMKNLVVTEYLCLHSHCKHCQRNFVAKLPPETKSRLFGENLIAATAYLKGRCHMSYTTIRDFYNDVFSIKVSTGFLAKQVQKVSKALKKPYEELLEQLPKEPHLHVDESGHKENGKLGWTWCFRGKKFTLFYIDESRGSAVLEKTLGTSYAGVLSSDFYSAYRKYVRLNGVPIQYCWAHVIREVKYLAERKVKKVSCYGKRVLTAIQSMFSTIHRRGKILERTWYRRMYCHRDEILKVAWRRLPDDNDAANLAKRLWNYQDDYFRFIDAGLPATNNLAEQSIRRVVIDRKITQGTRSDWGNRWQERIWSVLSTCAQTGRNVLSFLRDAVAALLGKRTAPKFLK